ncbi:MAG: metallophosphoesterase [Clostridia bacterium]|nr:metallophosphoesterase [Clostridia bacterium]
MKERFYTVKNKKIPESFVGFKILHISDLHSDMPNEIFDFLEREKPDIIAVTGDLIDNDKSPVDEMFEFVKSLSENTPLYFVSGNHDKNSERFMRFFEGDNKNIRFIDGKKVEIFKGEDKIEIFGIADPYSKRSDRARERLIRDLKKVALGESFSVLLYHRASHFDFIKDKGFDLVLSGHMHGGQVVFPRLGGLLPPKSSLFDTKRVFFPKYTGGEYEGNGTTMIVSRGTGGKNKLPRINNPTEIGVIELRND